MVRSATALIAVLILPGFASAQQAQGSHTVVDHDTLWDLAQRYFQNPWNWRVIWEANRPQIDDPNLIYPDQVFVIPGLPATGQSQTQAAAPAMPTTRATQELQPPPQPMPGAFREARPVGEDVRTIFHSDPSMAGSGVVLMQDLERLAVPRDQVYSAPWLIGLGVEPRRDGEIEGFADSSERGSTLRSFHSVRVAMSAATRVGAQLQTFRLDRTIPTVGEVVVSTGVLTVSAVMPDGVIATVSKEFARVQPGDLVRPLPSYTLTPGRYAETVAGGSEAMIMGFAGTAVLNNLGQLAFLDLGSNDGVGIGDEFVLYSEALGEDSRGSLQVVAVTETVATARIVSMDDDVFRQGVVVRLSKKMR